MPTKKKKKFYMHRSYHIFLTLGGSLQPTAAISLLPTAASLTTYLLTVECLMLFCSSNILQEIVERWGGPAVPLTSAAEDEEARKAGQAANQASLLHRLDLQCRRQLSEAMQQLQSRQVSLAGLIPEYTSHHTL